MDDESGYPYGYGNPHMPWIALSFVFPFLQTTVADFLALAKPSDIRWQSTDPFLRSTCDHICGSCSWISAIVYLWPKRIMFNSSEPLCKHLFKQTNCLYMVVGTQKCFRLSCIDFWWMNHGATKRPNQFANWLDLFQTQTACESFERETTYFWHG